MSARKTPLWLVLLLRLIWVLAFLMLARLLLWTMSWYSIRAALAIGGAYYAVQRLRRSEAVVRWRERL